MVDLPLGIVMTLRLYNMRFNDTGFNNASFLPSKMERAIKKKTILNRNLSQNNKIIKPFEISVSLI